MLNRKSFSFLVLVSVAMGNIAHAVTTGGIQVTSSSGSLPASGTQSVGLVSSQPYQEEEKGKSPAEVEQDFVAQIGDVQVKSAGVYILAKNPTDEKVYMLMGKMRKTNPAKPETHLFNNTFSAFTGKFDKDLDKNAIDTASREAFEETLGALGDQSFIRSMITRESTVFAKNQSWGKGFSAASFILNVEFDSALPKKFQSKVNELEADVRNNREIIEIAWISIDSLFSSVNEVSCANNPIWDKLQELGVAVPNDVNKSWKSLNTGWQGKVYAALQSLKAPNEKLSDLEKEPYRVNLPVLNDQGQTILIADYIVRTLLENEAAIRDYASHL